MKSINSHTQHSHLCIRDCEGISAPEFIRRCSSQHSSVAFHFSCHLFYFFVEKFTFSILYIYVSAFQIKLNVRYKESARRVAPRMAHGMPPGAPTNYYTQTQFLLMCLLKVWCVCEHDVRKSSSMAHRLNQSGCAGVGFFLHRRCRKGTHTTFSSMFFSLSQCALSNMFWMSFAYTYIPTIGDCCCHLRIFFRLLLKKKNILTKLLFSISIAYST